MPEQLQRIQQHFIDSADLKYQAAQALSRPIAAAVQAILACVTSGGKVLACGNGASAAEAQQFAAFCVAGFERERPELAAVALTCDSTLLTAAASGNAAAQQFARQVRALGQAGDVLLVLSVTGNDANLLTAAEAAQERGMGVLLLTGCSGGRLAAMLRETDVLINVPHDRAARVREVHSLVLHCLCDGVDTQLLGEQETLP
ncbi:SIS domain-containing protein [Verminephrobacter aporrectodeae]|uniref:SIS domain-containing protein n=1 Tax=Verminephrobacter aporrectodeae TaxID=1110389 RepID=UPI0002375B0A|nr:SIS domain-containing protein [Verminephrobacter aporrectodeae]MCW5222303.1 SIS domain-containing protein [Verminephrobacter aporrectodeae subsp. tuberculatae]MCW5287767.1 SIS domain-containing protein [Verminephrobacter aporrectodeae subsp. tuberculatae]MCW8165250.1 SIS domain-containing protein [Verminephrobacter aporrectodeae subsp. tuberculatae]MCW8169386.1 SIS domain-containing protein [Verminephrobacter aporrectodeae subsp. tuberculatae]MCW8175615.1 SIS domain-containing protein [Verm